MQRSIDEGFIQNPSSEDDTILDDIMIVSHDPVELVGKVCEQWTPGD
jgi:hypothetical protein